MTHQIGVAWLAAAVLLRQLADDSSLDDNLQQACLRRSISTAYYAVFHLITGDSTALVCVDAHESLVANRLRRSLNHADLKKVLASLLGSVEYDQKKAAAPAQFPCPCSACRPLWRHSFGSRRPVKRLNMHLTSLSMPSKLIRPWPMPKPSSTSGSSFLGISNNSLLNCCCCV